MEWEYLRNSSMPEATNGAALAAFPTAVQNLNDGRVDYSSSMPSPTVISRKLRTTMATEDFF